MAIDKKSIDQLLTDYKKPEDIEVPPSATRIPMLVLGSLTRPGKLYRPKLENPGVRVLLTA